MTEPQPRRGRLSKEAAERLNYPQHAGALVTYFVKREGIAERVFLGDIGQADDVLYLGGTVSIGADGIIPEDDL